jgi:hypothetical protein
VTMAPQGTLSQRLHFSPDEFALHGALNSPLCWRFIV